MFKVNKLFSLFAVVFSEQKHVLLVSIELQKHNWKLWRTWKSCGNNGLSARVPRAFLILANFPMCNPTVFEGNFHDKLNAVCGHFEGFADYSRLMHWLTGHCANWAVLDLPLCYKRFQYHRFRWYATLEDKAHAETFPKFPSIIHVIDRSHRNPPITAR